MSDNIVEIRIQATGADQAAKVLKGVADAGGQIGSIVATGSTKASAELSRLGDTGKRVFEIFTGVSLGNLFVDAIAKAKDFTVETIKLGAAARVQEEAFRLVADSVGASSTALSESLKRASAGITTQSDVMLASARALQQGLKPEQITALMEIARSQSKLTGATVAQAFNDITDAVTTLHTRHLKAYNIVVDSTKAYEAYARQIGTVASALTEAGQTQAIFIETQRTLAGRTLDTSSAIIKQAEAWERLQSQIKDTREEFGKAMIGMAIAVADAGKEIEQSTFMATMGKFFTWVTAQTVMGSAVGTPRAGLISGAELQSLRDMPDLLDETTNAASKVPAQFDAIKDAMAKVEQSTALVNARFASSRATFDDVATVTAAAITRLQALGATANPEVVLKIEALNAALLKAQLQIKALDDSLIALRMAPFVESAQAMVDATEAETKALADFQTTLVAANLQAEFESEAEALRVLADAGQKGIVAWADYSAALGRVEQEATALGQGLGETLAGKIRVTDEALKRAIADFGQTSDEVARLTGRLADLKTQAFGQTLTDIGIQARLLGLEFDPIGASLEAVKARMLELARASDGEMMPAIQALKAEFDRLVDVRETFGMLVTLAQNTSRAMTTAFSDLFFNIFTGNVKSMAAVWTGFLNSMLRAISDFLATSLVKQFAAVAVSALGGTGGIAAVLTGLAGGASASTGGGGGGAATTGTTAASTFASNFGTAGQIGAGIANMGQGILNIPSNFAAGGLTNTLFGTAPTFENIAGEAVQVTEGMQGLFGSTGQASAAFTALSGTLSAVGAALGVFMIAMDNTKTDLGKAIQSTTLAAGAALAPFTYGISTIVAFAINWIEDLFGLFGSNQLTHAQREQLELAKTTQTVAPLATELSKVLNQNKLVDLLIQYTSGTYGGTSAAAVQEGLVGPGGWVGIGNPSTAPGTVPQINDPAAIMKILTEHPEYLQVGVQAGVAQDMLAPMNDAFRNLILAAVARINAITAAEQQLATELPAQMQKLLPADLFQAFMTNTLDPMLARLHALIESGQSLDDLQAAFTALQAEIQVIAQAVAVYQQLGDEIAQLSGNLDVLTQSAQMANAAQLDASDKAVQDARSVLIEAISGPDIIAASQTLQQAILARYALEKQLVGTIETAIGGLLTSVGKPLMDLQIALATGPLARTGDTGPLAGLLDGLQHVAETSVSTTERLFAVSSGIQAIVAAVPAAITGGAVINPATILPTVMREAQPFLGQTTSLTAQAVKAGDFQGALTLLQQQVQMIQALGTAAVAGIQQWQQQAVAAAQAATQATVTGIQEAATTALDALNAQKAAIQDVATTQLDALNTQKSAIQDAAAAQLDALSTQKAAIQEAAAAELDRLSAQKSAIQDAAATQLDALATQKAAIQDSASVRLDALNAEKSAIQDAAGAQLDALAAQKSAIQDAAAARTDALSTEKTALEAQLAVARQWAQIVKSVGDYLTQLRLGPQAPPNPMGQFQLAQGLFGSAFAGFQATPTPEGATAVQKSAGDLLAAAQLIYTRPSPEYQRLFADVTGKLEQVKAVAVTNAMPEQAAAARLAAIDAELKTLQATTADQVKAIDLQTKTLRDASTDQVKALDAQLKATQSAETDQVKAIDAQSKLIGDTAKDQVKALDAQLKATQQAESDQIKAIDLQTKTIQDGTTAQVKALDAQLKTVQDDAAAQIKALDAQIKATQDTAAAQVKATQDAGAAQVAAINQVAKDQITNIQTTLEPILAGLAAQEQDLLSRLVGAQAQLLSAITGGATAAAFLAQKASETVEALTYIKTVLAEFLTGTGFVGAAPAPPPVPVPQPAPTPVPAPPGTAWPPPEDPSAIQSRITAGLLWGTGPQGAQHGAWYTTASLYRLHEGETVLPPAAASAFRTAASRMASGGGRVGMTPVAITIGDIHVHGDADAAKVAQQVIAQVEQSARRGRLKQILAEAGR